DRAFSAAKGPALAVLAVLLAGAFVFWRVRRGRRGGAEAWAEAACPACIGLGLIADRGPGGAGLTPEGSRPGGATTGPPFPSPAREELLPDVTGHPRPAVAGHRPPPAARLVPGAGRPGWSGTAAPGCWSCGPPRRGSGPSRPAHRPPSRTGGRVPRRVGSGRRAARRA